MRFYLNLFWVFFKIGVFTFGGGWAMISLIEREIVIRRCWLSKTEFLDLLTIAQSMPGILAVNIATIIGNKLRGLRGSLCASLGTIVPSFVIILLIAMFLSPEVIKNNEVLMRIFSGIRPCVVALIIAPVITTARSAGITLKTLWIPALVAILVYSNLPFVSNPILFILLGAIGGMCNNYLISRSKEK